VRTTCARPTLDELGRTIDELDLAARAAQASAAALV
jgi:hypothetical protein